MNSYPIRAVQHERYGDYISLTTGKVLTDEECEGAVALERPWLRLVDAAELKQRPLKEQIAMTESKEGKRTWGEWWDGMFPPFMLGQNLLIHKIERLLESRDIAVDCQTQIPHKVFSLLVELENLRVAAGQKSADDMDYWRCHIKDCAEALAKLDPQYNYLIDSNALEDTASCILDWGNKQGRILDERVEKEIHDRLYEKQAVIDRLHKEDGRHMHESRVWDKERDSLVAQINSADKAVDHFRACYLSMFSHTSRQERLIRKLERKIGSLEGKPTKKKAATKTKRKGK